MGKRVIGHDSFVYRASLYDDNPSHYGTHCVGVLYAVSEQALINVLESDKFLAKAKFVNEEIEGPVRLSMTFFVGEDRIDECVLALNMVGYFFCPAMVKENLSVQFGQSGHIIPSGQTGYINPVAITGTSEYPMTIGPSGHTKLTYNDTNDSNAWLAETIGVETSEEVKERLEALKEFVKISQARMLNPKGDEVANEEG